MTSPNLFRTGLLLALWLLTIAPCPAQSPARELLIRNTGDTPITETIVEIPWATVRAAYPQVDTARLRVMALAGGRTANRDTAGGQEVPYQLEHRGQSAVQNLLVLVSVGARQTLRLAMLPERPAPVTARTFCRYVPERKDDFAWENDRVAFRIYGPALEGTSENAYGTDIWAKRTNRLILNNWYRQNDYHRDHGEGLDYYHVGFTLGAGNAGLYLGDTIHYFRSYWTWQVLDNGPLRSTFRVFHAPQSFGSATVTLTKTITIDAGSQLSRIELQTQSTPADLPMVAGITLRPDAGELTTDELTGVLSYWEPRHGDDGTLGVGCVFAGPGSPATAPTMRRAQQHGLARFKVSSGKPVVYYAGGAWDKAGRIQSADQWRQYLRQMADALRHPVTISIH